MIRFILRVVTRTDVKYELLSLVLMIFFGLTDTLLLEVSVIVTGILMLGRVYYASLNEMTVKYLFFYSVEDYKQVKYAMLNALLVVTICVVGVIYGIDYIFSLGAFSHQLIMSIAIFFAVSYLLPIHIERTVDKTEPFMTKTDLLLLLTLTYVLNFGLAFLMNK